MSGPAWRANTIMSIDSVNGMETPKSAIRTYVVYLDLSPSLKVYFFRVRCILRSKLLRTVMVLLLGVQQGAECGSLADLGDRQIYSDSVVM
jgi:hypothetical protein